MNEDTLVKSKKVGFAIRKQNTAFTRRFMNEGFAVGLDEVTMMHAWVMGYLHRNEDKEIYQKSLESEFGIGRSSVASLVKLMESKGYIKREAVPKDARLKKIMLTAQGRESALKVKYTLDRMEKDVLRDISPEELQIYFSVADKIVHNLDNQ